MISVVMISMNEEKSIAAVVSSIRANVPDAEIVLVDSSSDSTAKIAESLGVKVIRQVPPKGYGPAMDMALKSASGDVIITMDCDNTYPSARIPEFAKYVLTEGYDVVDGSRLKCKPAAMPWINYLANYFFAAVASVLFFKRITDLHSGMRAYKKELIARLKYEPKGAALPVELLLRPLKIGCRIKFEFIDYFDRTGVSTMRPMESAWWTVKRILSVRFS